MGENGIDVEGAYALATTIQVNQVTLFKKLGVYSIFYRNVSAKTLKIINFEGNEIVSDGGSLIIDGLKSNKVTLRGRFYVKYGTIMSYLC